MAYASKTDLKTTFVDLYQEIFDNMCANTDQVSVFGAISIEY